MAVEDEGNSEEVETLGIWLREERMGGPRTVDVLECLL